jgi:hypothetical protein
MMHVVDDTTMLELLRFIKAHQNSQQIDEIEQKLDEAVACVKAVMRSQATEPPPAADSPVSVQRSANGNIEISVTGKHGTLQLEVNPDEPTLCLRDPERAARFGRRYKFVCELAANGEVQGWFVSEAHNPPDQDRISFLPVTKKRVTERPPKKKRDC